MIRLGGLISQKAFGKFEMGKVISNPFATAFKPMNERVDMNALSDELKRLIKKYPGKQITYSFITNNDYPKGYVFFINGKILKEGEESQDHEVSMANNSLDTIIKMATELKAKMGEDEKDIPAWIQDHITNAENFISQASSNYHEYGTNESVVSEGNTAFETLMLIRNLEQTNKLLAQDLKTSKQLPNDKKENIKKSIVVNQGLINYYKENFKNLKNNESVNEAQYPSFSDPLEGFPSEYKELLKKLQRSNNSDERTKLINKMNVIRKNIKLKPLTNELVKEASPCWKGYKQVGMKDKGGKQVPNCVPNK